MAKIQVAFQGIYGSNSQLAIEKAFPDDEVTPISFPTFQEVFAAVEDARCDYAVVPMENSLQGSIHQVYYLLARTFLYITKEVYVPIHYSLIGLPGARPEDITLVITHPAALDECRLYLEKLPQKPAIETLYDSAGAVNMMLNFSNEETAMVGAKALAELNQLEVLAESIEDHENNVTRYNVIAREPINPGKNGKTSIVFTTFHTPGALLKAMSVFAERGLDLTKIESRPLIDQPYEYMFYADVDGPVSEPRVKEALDELSNYHTPWMRILGSYLSIREDIK